MTTFSEFWIDLNNSLISQGEHEATLVEARRHYNFGKTDHEDAALWIIETRRS